jgi:hypothetical protein
MEKVSVFLMTMMEMYLKIYLSIYVGVLYVVESF